MEHHRWWRLWSSFIKIVFVVVQVYLYMFAGISCLSMHAYPLMWPMYVCCESMQTTYARILIVYIIHFPMHTPPFYVRSHICCASLTHGLTMLWQEQDVTITKLRHQIDEAEVEISRQSKLIQSQALELEEIGPCSEFLCKHEVSFIQSETKALRGWCLLRWGVKRVIRVHGCKWE